MKARIAIGSGGPRICVSALFSCPGRPGGIQNQYARTAVATVRHRLPPVRGCVHARLHGALVDMDHHLHQRDHHGNRPHAMCSRASRTGSCLPLSLESASCTMPVVPAPCRAGRPASVGNVGWWCQVAAVHHGCGNAQEPDSDPFSYPKRKTPPDQGGAFFYRLMIFLPFYW